MSSIAERVKTATISTTLNQSLKYLDKDLETNLPKVMELVDKVTPEAWYEEPRNAIRNVIQKKNHWYELIMKVMELDTGVRNTFLKNFMVNASLSGDATPESVREKEGCNVPWAILLDPTSCYTSQNYQDITSEEYFDMIIDAGALFVWFFHYMPVGNGAAPQLLPSPEQRTEVYHRIREYRSRKPIFSMDFQNDAEYVGGCIAGGRRYLHINAKGDVEPCVFVHYSNANIRECTLLEALKSPIFMAYHDGQPFNENMLRPCPMLENPEKVRAMVKETNAQSTDYESPETIDSLCDRCTPYAENWKPTADILWNACSGCQKGCKEKRE